MASKIFLNIEQGRNSDRAMTKLIIKIPPAFVSILAQNGIMTKIVVSENLLAKPFVK